MMASLLDHGNSKAGGFFRGQAPSAREWCHGDLGPALPLLSRHGHCATWHDTARQATVSVP